MGWSRKKLKFFKRFRMLSNYTQTCTKEFSLVLPHFILDFQLETKMELSTRPQSEQMNSDRNQSRHSHLTASIKSLLSKQKEIKIEIEETKNNYRNGFNLWGFDNGSFKYYIKLDSFCLLLN